MYVLSKDEYLSLQKKQSTAGLCPSGGGDISDSRINNIGVSHGGTVNIHPGGGGGVGGGVNNHSFAPSSSHQAPNHSPRDFSNGYSGVRRREKRGGGDDERGGGGNVVNVTSSPVSHSEGSRGTDDGSFFAPPNSREQRNSSSYTSPSSEEGRGSSIPPPPTNLRRQATLNAAALARREKVMMKQLVEERLDRLSGRRRRRDDRGDEREMLHQLRDVNQQLHNPKKRKLGGNYTLQPQTDVPMETNQPQTDVDMEPVIQQPQQEQRPIAPPLLSIAVPSMATARRASKRKRGPLYDLVEGNAVQPATILEATRKGKRTADSLEWSGVPHAQKRRLSYSIDPIAGNKRPAVDELEMEEAIKRSRHRFPYLEEHIAGKKRKGGVRDAADIQLDPFHYEPLVKRGNTRNAAVRFLGNIAGHKRKMTERDWAIAEMEASDALPPPKRGAYTYVDSEDINN